MIARAPGEVTDSALSKEPFEFTSGRVGALLPADDSVESSTWNERRSRFGKKAVNDGFARTNGRVEKNSIKVLIPACGTIGLPELNVCRRCFFPCCYGFLFSSARGC